MIRKMNLMSMLHYWSVLTLLHFRPYFQYISISIHLVNKEYFTHFLKCHNKAWLRPATQQYARQCEHHQNNRKVSNKKWHTTQAALKIRENEIERALCSGWCESSTFIKTSCERLVPGSMLALAFSNIAFASQFWTRLS